MSNRLQTESLPKKISCRIIQGQSATKFPKIQLGWECVFSHRGMSCLASGLFLFSCVNQPRADYKMNWRGKKKGISLASFLPFPLPFSCRWHRYESSSVHLAPKVPREEEILGTLDSHISFHREKQKKEKVGNVF